ncbi:MAG: PDZ domain-containing protein [Pseudohongiellaceae bacterium]|nr:PDZ domain-containing protein [Pseudohongiellaceae bacterium]
MTNTPLLQKLKSLVVALLCAGLAACIGSQPTSVVPSIAMSGETVSYNSTRSAQDGYDFGLTVSVNESDSLTNLEILPGVRVRSVADNSPAARSGIRVGDIILEVDGKKINQPDTLSAIATQAGEDEKRFRFIARRNTSVFETQLTARRLNPEQFTPVELYRSDPIATRAGYVTQLVDADMGQFETGAKVVEFFDKSPLREAGIEINDIIIRIDKRPLESAQDLITTINGEYELGDSVELGFIRNTSSGSSMLEKNVKLWSPKRRISDISLGPLLQYSQDIGSARTQLSIGDFWLFSLFDYSHIEGEKQYTLFEFFRFSSGYGELVEDASP